MSVLGGAARRYREKFDRVNGGLSGAPKFPSSLPVRFLLREHRRTGDGVWLDMAVLTLEQSKGRLLEVRVQRPLPLQDRKSLAAWNGLMISAFARAAFVLDDPGYAARAARAADFVLTRMRDGDRLQRSFKDGRAHLRGYLDDYAFAIAGLLDLYETTGEPRWLREAVALDAVLERSFEDPEGGGYFLVGEGHEPLLAREKPALDGAEPSGNSVQALNLLRLHELTTDDRYRRRTERTLAAFSPTLSGQPGALPEMLLAVDFRRDVAKEIVIVTPSRAEAEPFLEELRSTFLPNRVLAVVEVADLAERAALVPLVRGKLAQGGRPTVYVCEKQVCKRPTTDPEVFAQLIDSPRNPPQGGDH